MLQETWRVLWLADLSGVGPCASKPLVIHAHAGGIHSHDAHGRCSNTHCSGAHICQHQHLPTVVPSFSSISTTTYTHLQKSTKHQPADATVVVLRLLHHLNQQTCTSFTLSPQSTFTLSPQSTNRYVCTPLLIPKSASFPPYCPPIRLPPQLAQRNAKTSSSIHPPAYLLALSGPLHDGPRSTSSYIHLCSLLKPARALAHRLSSRHANNCGKITECHHAGASGWHLPTLLPSRTRRSQMATFSCHTIWGS